MPRRRHDPAGLPDQPTLVTDPAREAELIAEFLRRYEFIVTSYRNEKQLALGTKGHCQSNGAALFQVGYRVSTRVDRHASFFI